MEEIAQKVKSMKINSNRSPSEATPSLKGKTERSDKRKASDLFRDEEELVMFKKYDEVKNSAFEEKILGNYAYGQRDFEKAMLHYRNALKKDPDQIVYYLNMAAVHFECKRYQECIDECFQGLKIVKPNADKSLVAKAHARIARSYKKLGRFRLARDHCEQALEYDSTSEVLNLKTEMEQKLSELRHRFHIDPLKAEEENELGNQLYQQEKYDEALSHFTEAVRCNPNNPRMFINRSACRAKLRSYILALEDAERSISLDEKLIQGHILKGKILEKLHRTSDARDAFKKALEIDPKNAIALFGCQNNEAPGNIVFEDDEKADADSSSAGGEGASDGLEKIVDLDNMDSDLLDIFRKVSEDPDSMALHLSNPKVAQSIKKIFYG